MKRILLLCALISLPLMHSAQEDIALNDPEAYFSAIIVKDMNASLSWYKDNLGFAVLDQNEYETLGIKQANLKRGTILIELIAIKTAISPKDVIPNYNNKTKVQGFFKFGMLVSDFDNWVTHLTKRNVDFHGRVVIDGKTRKRMVIIKDPDGNKIQLFEK